MGDPRRRRSRASGLAGGGGTRGKRGTGACLGAACAAGSSEAWRARCVGPTAGAGSRDGARAHAQRRSARDVEPRERLHGVPACADRAPLARHAPRARDGGVAPGRAGRTHAPAVCQLLARTAGQRAHARRRRGDLERHERRAQQGTVSGRREQPRAHERRLARSDAGTGSAGAAWAALGWIEGGGAAGAPCPRAA
jgi:hypothetical protein